MNSRHIGVKACLSFIVFFVSVSNVFLQGRLLHGEQIVLVMVILLALFLRAQTMYQSQRVTIMVRPYRHNQSGDIFAIEIGELGNVQSTSGPLFSEDLDPKLLDYDECWNAEVQTKLSTLLFCKKPSITREGNNICPSPQ
jgi:hypothetical protein